VFSQLTCFIIEAMQKILTPCKRTEFEKLVRITKNIDEKDRLRAILAYDDGHDVSDIADKYLSKSYLVF